MTPLQAWMILNDLLTGNASKHTWIEYAAAATALINYALGQLAGGHAVVPHIAAVPDTEMWAHAGAALGATGGAGDPAKVNWGNIIQIVLKNLPTLIGLFGGILGAGS